MCAHLVVGLGFVEIIRLQSGLFFVRIIVDLVARPGTVLIVIDNVNHLFQFKLSNLELLEANLSVVTETLTVQIDAKIG